MRHFFKLVFSLFLIVVLVGAIGGWYFLKNFDLNRYKTLIEQQAYIYTGRELKINGNARLGISFVPTVIVNDVTFANASWASNPYMAKIDKLSIEVALKPLLKREVVVNSIELESPHIYLEKNAAGLTNWTFTPAGKKQAASQTLAFAQLELSPYQTAAKNSALTGNLQNISLKNISINNGFLQYLDEAAGKPQEITLKNLDFSMNDLNSPINLSFDAVYDSEPINGEIVAGSLNSLLSGAPFDIQANLQAYRIKAAISGVLQDILKTPAYALNTNIYSPAGNFNAPETTLIADVSGNLQQINAVINTLNIANNLITGSLKADISQKLPNISANLKSDKIDIRTLQVGEPLAAEFGLVTSAHAAEYIPNDIVPYPFLLSANGALQLNINKLILDDGLSADNVKLNATLNNGVLTLKPLTLNFGGGNIDLNSVINAKNKSLTLNLTSKDILLQELHKEFVVAGKKDFGVLEGGKTFLSAKLTSQGNTYRQLVQNLHGQSVMILKASQLQTGSLQFLQGDFISQLLSTLGIDTKKSTNLDLQCAVIRTDFAGGKAAFPDGIAIQSDKMTLAGNGNLNLINDKIDFSIVPAVNFDTGITQALSSLINIKGTVMNPQIALNDKQALQTIVGIATTGGMAYLGSQALLSDNSPCFTALKGTSFQSYVPQPSASAQATQNAVADTKAAYKEGKKAIKQELKNIEQNAKDFINLFKKK